jgi:hypothetical protein
MIIEEPKTLSGEHLGFLRWLAEHGRLEQQVHGPSTGMAADGHVRRVLEYAGKSS